MSSQQENRRKAAWFEHPEYIPMTFAINSACWHHYPQERLFDLMEEHPFLFPGFTRPKGEFCPEYAPVARKDAPYTDDFGCVWSTCDDGITGTVTGHPLADWNRFSTWRAPDPAVSMGLGPIDWAKERRRVEQARAAGDRVGAGLRHGHTFLQLCDLRGYENLLCDMADGEERLWELIDRVEQFNLSLVRRYVDLGVDEFGYGEDLGMQYGPMLSRQMFLTYIKPTYRRLMRPALEKGLLVHMHSDGDIRELADDLIDSGVQVINLQDLVNGVDWIARRYAGKVCVDLDIDRQRVTPFGTPAQIDALIRSEVEALGSPAGGLMMIYGLYPGVPLENIKALMDAMEKYAFYYS